MTNVINLRRLPVAVLVLAVLLTAVYLLVLREDGGAGAPVTAAALRETPPSASASKAGIEVGRLAPDFEISTTDGRRVRLSEFRGRPVVLNFFALWCTSCLTEMPQLKAAQEERGLDSFAVLAINAGETRERALEFVDFLDAPFTFGLDTSLVVSDAYRVYGLPASVFVDADGVIQAIYAGSTDKQRLDAFLDAAITAQPPSDLPVVLRLINTIPRERVLRVESSGDELKLSSRSLRCDAGYCAEAVVTHLKTLAGIGQIMADLMDAEPSLTVRFDAAVITREQLIDAATEALEALEDPVYQGPVRLIADSS